MEHYCSEEDAHRREDKGDDQPGLQGQAKKQEKRIKFMISPEQSMSASTATFTTSTHKHTLHAEEPSDMPPQ